MVKPPKVTCSIPIVDKLPVPPSPTLSQAGAIIATKETKFKTTAANIRFACALTFRFRIIAKPTISKTKIEI